MEMNGEPFIVSSPKDDMICMRVTPGHFATSNSHVSHYLDMSVLKRNARVAMDVARDLAIPYLGVSAVVDTIVCMEGTEIIGAFLAQQLLQNDTMIMNSDNEIHVLTPTNNTQNHLSFLRSEHDHIAGKQIILLFASVSSGSTISRALDCLSYYGGELIGISALFTALEQVREHRISALFTPVDIPGYRSSRPSECDMCKQGQKLDGIVTGRSYADLYPILPGVAAPEGQGYDDPPVME